MNVDDGIALHECARRLHWWNLNILIPHRLYDYEYLLIVAWIGDHRIVPSIQHSHIFIIVPSPTFRPNVGESDPK